MCLKTIRADWRQIDGVENGKLWIASVACKYGVCCILLTSKRLCLHDSSFACNNICIWVCACRVNVNSGCMWVVVGLAMPMADLAGDGRLCPISLGCL